MMTLRSYQNGAVEGAFNAFKEYDSTLIVLPTGLGKTVVFSEIVRRFQPARSIVIAHREELIFQAADKIRKVTGLEGAVEMGQYRADGLFETPPYIVSTVQTQCSGGDGGGRMTKFLPDDFGLVVIDEAHHATSSTYKRVINYYRQNPKCKILGVTATPDRADEEALGQVFESVAYEYQILDAIKQGWLVPIQQQMVTVGSMDFSGIRTTAGDLNQGELAEVMEDERNLHEVASPVLGILKEKRAIIFATTVRQAERLTEILNRSAPNSADWVCGATPKEDRHRKLADFKAGRTRYMVNVGVLTEGFDDAGVEAVVMARPTKSRALYAQMIGRATRPAAEIAARLGEIATPEARRDAIARSSKPSCLVLDFVGNSGRHKLITSADILGGKYPDEVVERAKSKAKDKAVDMREALESAAREHDEIERRKAAQAERRKAITAMARYCTTRVNPFDRFDLVPVQIRPDDPPRHYSPAQAQFLREQFRVDPTRLPYAQGKQLLDEYGRRRDAGLASYRQSLLLNRKGIPVPMRFDEAKRALNRRVG